jgi:hypothetical protein
MATGMVPLMVGNHPYRVAGWLPYAAWAMLVAIASRDPHLAEQRQAWSVFLTGAQTCAAMAICSRLLAICPPASFARLGWAGESGGGTGVCVRWTDSGMGCRG